MKTSYFFIAISVMLIAISTIFAQIKNPKTETFHVNGNCEMCKKNIETAGNKKKESQVTWDAASQSATIRYDAEKTSADAVLKRIALKGYDNEKYLSPDETYAELHGCCQYERTLKGKNIIPSTSHNNDSHNRTTMDTEVKNTQKQPIEVILSSYFALKDALVNSNAKETSTQANKLLATVENIKMESFANEAHQIWMANAKEIMTLSQRIAKSQDITNQRQSFATLSNKIYPLVKASPLSTTVYYQNCPMFDNGKGAQWLSLNEEIKNPFYGSKMMTCGSVKEKID